MTVGKHKGNAHEWETCRKFSRWLTGGEDATQLVPSQSSGGNARLKAVYPNSRPEFHVGDVAPNGPVGEAFRSAFSFECKNYKDDPNWWHLFSSTNFCIEEWWVKIRDESDLFGLEPLLVCKRNFMPEVVGFRSNLYRSNEFPILAIPHLGMIFLRLTDFFDFSPEFWMGRYAAYHTVKKRK